jgi:hypothetical protein
MYPLKGDLQDLKQKRGVEVDVKGWGDVMEGASRREFPSVVPSGGRFQKLACTSLIMWTDITAIQEP